MTDDYWSEMDTLESSYCVKYQINRHHVYLQDLQYQDIQGLIYNIMQCCDFNKWHVDKLLEQEQMVSRTVAQHDQHGFAAKDTAPCWLLLLCP